MNTIRHFLHRAIGLLQQLLGGFQMPGSSSKSILLFSGPSMPDPILDLFKTAWRVYEEGDSEQVALALTEIVIASDDGNYPVFVLMRAHLLQSLCHANLGDTETARAEIAQGLSLSESEPDAVIPERLLLLEHRVKLSFAQGRKNSALAGIQQILTIAESSPFASQDSFRLHVLAPSYFNVALLSFENLFYREAARCFRLAHEIWCQYLSPDDEYVQRSQSGLQAALVMLLEDTFYDEQ